MKITTTAFSKRQRARFNIYKKQKITKRLYIYKNPYTLKKARQFPLRLYIQNPDTLRYLIFHESFEDWHLYTKSMTLCVT